MLANADTFSLSIARIHTHRRYGIEKEIAADPVDHLLLVVGEVAVEDEFDQVEDIGLVLIAIVLGNVRHDFEDFAIRRLHLDKVTVEDLGSRPCLGRHKLFEIFVHNFPSVFKCGAPHGKLNLGQI